MFKPGSSGQADTPQTSSSATKVTPEEVIAAIEMILGRTPDDALVNYHMQLGFNNRFELGTYMIETGEFKQRWNARLRQPIFLGDRVLASTHRGEPIYVIPDDLDLTPAMLFSGAFEAHVERVIKGTVQAGAIAIDAGTNVGYHTLSIAAAVGPHGKVHAFEANPHVMKLFKATMVLNRYTDFRGHGRVEIHAMAVSNKTGSLILEQAPGHFGSGHLVTDSPASDFGPEYSSRTEVPTVAIDDYLGSTIPSLDFLHMDIEGAEPLAMEGMRQLIARSPTLRIVREWSVHMMSTMTDLSKHIRYLVDEGFRFWLINQEGTLNPVNADDLINLDHCDLFISRQNPPSF